MLENRHIPLTLTHCAPWPNTSISAPAAQHCRISSRELASGLWRCVCVSFESLSSLNLLCFCLSGVFACRAASSRNGGLKDAGHEGRKKVPAERCPPKGVRRSAGKDGLEARGAGGEPHAGRALWPGRRRMCGKLAKTGHPVNGAADDARGVQHAGGACARLPDPGQGTWKAAFACAGPAGLRRDRQARSWSRTRLSCVFPAGLACGMAG